MQKRLPDFPSMLQVYAVITVMFAGWTITAFLWKLSAWLLLLDLGELFTIFAYAMTANFLESLVILLILLAACMLLPAHILRDDFVVRGTILSAGLTGALITFVGSEMQFGIESGLRLLIIPLVVLSAMSFLLYRSSTYPHVRSTAIWLSDRVTVFLFLLLPLFALFSAYVIFRNVT
jgi:hypothetical protein